MAPRAEGTLQCNAAALRSTVGRFDGEVEPAARDEARNRIEHHCPVNGLPEPQSFGSGAYLGKSGVGQILTLSEPNEGPLTMPIQKSG